MTLRIMRVTLILATLLVAPTSAFALDQSAHQEISRTQCGVAGLPEDFCERVGTEAYNVDSYEWNQPEAHSQLADSGENSVVCNGANAVLQRERVLGADIRASLETLSYGASEDLATHIATQLGRALHTVQDGCAHHGMPNQQHAWASLTDTCTGSLTSPDLDPEAARCARTETDAIFAAFVDEMATAGVSGSDLDGIREGWTHWPSRGDVCAFLDDAANWDGADQRWENAVVVPWVRDQLTHAITTDDSSIGDACADAASLVVVQPHALADVSKKPKWCLKVNVYCLGKGDAPDAPPPWESEEAMPATAGDAGGCAVGGSGSSSLVLVIGALGFVVARRRC